jgi:hypothetical protein
MAGPPPRETIFACDFLTVETVMIAPLDMEHLWNVMKKGLPPETISGDQSHREGGPRCSMSESIGHIGRRSGAHLPPAGRSSGRVASLLTGTGSPSLFYVWARR